MDRDSSDEDEDRESLIHQNDTKHNHQQQLHTIVHDEFDHPHSTLHIDDSAPSSRRRAGFNFSNVNKRYLFAIFLPLLILILYFSVDLRSLFPASIAKFRLDSITDSMRESELRALSLLKQQQSQLVSIWNQSFFNINNSNSNNNSNPFFQDAKSIVLDQISLNKQIQQVLLSPHKVSNFSQNDDAWNPLFGFNSCRKNDSWVANKRTIEWKPKSDKYLFAICLSGQMSNHLICLEKHMFFAAVLGRILVMPSFRVDYQYSRVLDIEHINNCVGRKVVASFEEFEESRTNHLHIEKFICYFSSPRPCYIDDEHMKKLKQLELTIGKIETPWKEDTKKPSKKTIQDIKAKFKADDDVIAIGDVFYADVERDWVMQPGGPIAHKCKTLVEPSRLILLTAQRFVQTFLGSNFIALHFRRHGFLKFCNAKKPSCFYSIPQAADCITRIVERANAPVIYLSTDAAESETSLLQSLVVVNGKTIPLVKRPARNSAEKWDSLLYRHHLEGDAQVEAMLDKTICGLSSVFIGAPGSTFTEDILRLRKGWGSASVCDEYLCQGEDPNFIAEDE
ncbi:O-fucosyltransferase 36-like [Pistacia vera]|uniref:O-fucosyltransferase 36-like n=1 Tax=Pistacia vera TaxID=55513 RepID=UPI001263848B|nr:O-fucosyltransferase 36-like [Pistacia vera]